MESTPILRCMIDLNKPVEELVEVIAAVINVQPSMKLDILRGLDEAIGQTLVQLHAGEEKAEE
ncbi:hypothetical protein [Paenibacillus dendritiformis]|uniref:hypothetical protein n=1 Tax=Paenibacillus dendritiformis TaxID=130049 RepID=UPI00387E1C8E